MALAVSFKLEETNIGGEIVPNHQHSGHEEHPSEGGAEAVVQLAPQEVGEVHHHSQTPPPPPVPLPHRQVLPTGAPKVEHVDTGPSGFRSVTGGR